MELSAKYKLLKQLPIDMPMGTIMTEDEWNNHYHISARAYPDWFERVDEFKVGDWVTVIKNVYGYDYVDKEIGKTYQIKRYNCTNDFGVHCWYVKPTLTLAENSFRLATKEEIEKAQRPAIKVGDYVAKYNLTAGLVEFGCKRYGKDKIETLYDIMTRLNIAAIKVEGEMVSYYQVEQIRKGFLD